MKGYYSFNINDYILFKINPNYEKKICEYWSSYYKNQQTIDMLFGKEERTGYRRCQAWQFMFHISPFIIFGYEPPCETLILIKDKDLHKEKEYEKIYCKR